MQKSFLTLYRAGNNQIRAFNSLTPRFNKSLSVNQETGKDVIGSTRVETEALRHEKDASHIEQLWQGHRWLHTKRDYTAKEVAALQGTMKVQYPANHTQKKLYDLLRNYHQTQGFAATYGALDPVQVINQSKYLECIYVSGWQCSSTASSSQARGPDFADYPSNTVPEKVGQLFEAQMFEDRLQNEDRLNMSEAELASRPRYDFMCPIIADGDCGFGGVTSTMKLAKMMIEAGAAGIHIEDQKAGVKKCGHMAGKVIVAFSEWKQRIQAARLQSDIMNSELIIVARTDVFSGKWIDSNHCEIDHPFILGVTDPAKPEDLKTFIEAGVDAIKNLPSEKQSVLAQWEQQAPELSLNGAKKLAKQLGFEFYFDWEAPRSVEGFYALQKGSELAAHRAKHIAGYADMCWMETPTADLADAKDFRDKVRANNKDLLLAYNLSPSFNWSQYDDEYIRQFSFEIGKLGYVWQFCTLAGFHSNALISELLARRFSKEKIFAFHDMIQRKEREHGVDQLKHQKWSGAQLVDKEMTLVTKSTTTAASGADCTESQFKQNITPAK